MTKCIRVGRHTFYYGLQGPLISFQSTLWKRQNVITFSGCIKHSIATIYFHFICLSNTGASAGNCFKFERGSIHNKSSFSPTLNGFFGATSLFSSHFMKLSNPNYFCRSREIALTSVLLHMFCFKSGNRYLSGPPVDKV